MALWSVSFVLYFSLSQYFGRLFSCASGTIRNKTFIFVIKWSEVSTSALCGGAAAGAATATLFLSFSIY